MIRSLFISVLILLTTTKEISAQYLNQAERTFSCINQKVSSVRQGYFDSNYRWKSALKEDTSGYAARIYFFRDISDQDSICQFIAVLDGKLWKAYDGTYFYYVDSESRTILARPVSEKGTVKKYIATGIQDFLAFRPYILGAEKPPFNLGKYKKAQIDTVNQGNENILIAILIDSFPNPLQASSNDPPMAQLREIFTIALPDMVIRQKQEWVYFIDQPQYLETHLSPVFALPDTVTFSNVFPLDSLLSSGYSFTNNLPIQPIAKPTIQPGDTLPPFVLTDLNGDSIRFWEGKEYLVLFDFWYRSCGYCLKAMPAIEAIHQKFNSTGLKVWGINPVDKNADQVRRFLIQRGVSYPSLLDTEKLVSTMMGVRAYPTAILVNTQNHKVLYVQTGYSSTLGEEIEKAIEANK